MHQTSTEKQRCFTRKEQTRGRGQNELAWEEVSESERAGLIQGHYAIEDTRARQKCLVSNTYRQELCEGLEPWWLGLMFSSYSFSLFKCFHTLSFFYTDLISFVLITFNSVSLWS